MDNSHLSRLSAELRNVIYEFVFTSPYAIPLHTNAAQHALTRTCRRIRHESLSMYYNIARFNAHLDDGPATPLANWIKILGPELMLRINEINIWDLHNLNGTLHGTDSTSRLLSQSKPRFTLRPLSLWVTNRGWYLREVILTLHEMGLDLLRFCEVDESCQGAARLKLTSEFAIVEQGEGSQCDAQEEDI